LLQTPLRVLQANIVTFDSTRPNYIPV